MAFRLSDRICLVKQRNELFRRCEEENRARVKNAEKGLGQIYGISICLVQLGAEEEHRAGVNCPERGARLASLSRGTNFFVDAKRKTAPE